MASQFNGFLGFPGSTAVGKFGLVQAIDRLGQCVIVAVTTAPHPWLYASLGNTFGAEGIKAGQATAVAVWMARQGESVVVIRQGLTPGFGYDLSMTVDTIRPGYKFTEASQHSVPQALVCALEAVSFEDALRNAVSIGGDSDTIGAIAGAVAEARFGVPDEIAAKTWTYLPRDMRVVVKALYRAG